ncbi:branched-chain amino acid ABC transporter permease [Thermodesulfobacteriota bacterium]
MDFFLQLLLPGICVGAVYALGAIGFVLIYKASKIFNVAHGEMMMTGALVAVTFAVKLELPMFLAFLCALVVTAIIGMIIQFLIIRPLTGQSLFSILMATVALIFVFRGGSLLLWSHKFYAYPGQIFPLKSLMLGGAILAPSYINSLLLAIIMIILLGIYFKFTKSGLTMRAIADDVQLAESIGVRVGKSFGVVWALAGATAAVGGISLGMLTNVDVMLGELGLKVLPVVVVGGMESIAGACIGGLIVGITSSLSGGYLEGYLPGFKDVAPFIIMLIVLLIRPNGIFGEKRIERI